MSRVNRLLKRYKQKREKRMNTSTLLHVRPGKLADRAVVEAVMKAYPTVFGFAVQHENELVCEQHETMFTIEQFEELDAGTKDGN